MATSSQHGSTARGRLGRQPAGWLVLLMCLAGAGCSGGPAGGRQTAQIEPGPNGGFRFVGTSPAVSFPLPSGWSMVKPSGDDDPEDIHLRAQAGACAVLVTRHIDFFGDEAEHIQGIAKILDRDGHPTRLLDQARVGGREVPHIHSDFGSGVDEDIYGLRSGILGLTLMTVHGRTCATDFGPLLQGVRL